MCKKFADGIAEVHEKDLDAPTYCGMRLIAVDGTDITLVNSTKLKAMFGGCSPKRDVTTVLGSMAYCSLDHTIYDCQIAPYATEELD